MFRKYQKIAFVLLANFWITANAHDIVIADSMAANFFSDLGDVLLEAAEGARDPGAFEKRRQESAAEEYRREQRRFNREQEQRAQEAEMRAIRIEQRQLMDQFNQLSR